VGPRAGLIVSEKRVLSLPGIYPRYLSRLACGLAIKPSEFPRPLSNIPFTWNSSALSLGLITKRQKRREVVKVKCHEFPTSALHRDEMSASRYGHFRLTESDPSSCMIGD
jgi:hypothetical protein